MTRQIAVMALALLPLVALGATRTHTVNWTWEPVTVDGDAIPAAAVGVFRIYTSAGQLVATAPATARTASFSWNFPWGQTCFKATSSYSVNTTEYVSEFSNVAGCIDVAPGKPQPPKVQ